MESGNPTVGLAERIRLGEKPAEETLVERFYPRVYAIALARTRDREVARDLAQEILLGVLCALREGRLRDESGLTGYICATARNRVSDFFRGRGRESTADPLPDPVLDQVDPEKSFEEAERRELALAAIERLSSKDQKILRLTLVEGLKPGEIAVKLGLDAGVVRKRKSRAVRRAREIIRRGLSRTKA